MYLISIVLLLFVLPIASIAAELAYRGGGADVTPLIGKWFVFWAVGVRLFIAGVRQVVQPQFTAEDIFDVKEPGALPLVREIGFGNLSMGTLGLASLAISGFLVPAAIVGGLYYGLAGAGHLARGGRNFAGQTAMVTDLWAFVVLAVFIASRGV